MSLLDLKNYFVRAKVASLSSLCVLFKMDPDVLRCMLDHWVRKGRIRKFTKTPACGGQCMKCSPVVTEIYEWV